jgi:DNA-binding NarL/FixJ family response regulator
VATVLICADRWSVREGLARVISAVAGIRRIDGAADGDELLARYARQPADVVLVGIQRGMSRGVDATRRLVAAHPQATVVVFGAADNAGGVASAIAAGAHGYLRWDATHPGFGVAATLTAAATPCAAMVAQGRADSVPPLSERELQVLVGMSQGKTNSQIGRELFLARSTVKTHAQRLFRKFGVQDRAEAVAHGFRRGLVT